MKYSSVRHMMLLALLALLIMRETISIYDSIGNCFSRYHRLKAKTKPIINIILLPGINFRE